MKRMNLKTWVAVACAACAALLLSACRPNEAMDPNLDIPNLGGYEYPKTELDVWLEETFLIPYNIEIVYRWDASMIYTSIGKKITPVQEAKVKPMMSALAKMWFDPFLYAAPYGFLQRYAPKTIVLAGSPEYAAGGGAMVLGTAEGAARIFLSNVNAFEPSNETVLRDYLRVIEHEYGHILNQFIYYPVEFNSISRAFYDPTGWGNYEDDDAFKRGFFSPYSMSSPEEDFVEVVAWILIRGLDWFENTVIPIAQTSTENPQAASHLRQKLAIVEKYYKDAFNIALFDDRVTGEKGLATLVDEAFNYVLLHN
ncbi:MAG: putative zinc-binding metallopeptidase [Prevotellaceae bacterium]|nr:putative zinc-binding metallopeptidase [Prevotellaceae bacterium]